MVNIHGPWLISPLSRVVGPLPNGHEHRLFSLAVIRSPLPSAGMILHDSCLSLVDLVGCNPVETYEMVSINYWIKSAIFL